MPPKKTPARRKADPKPSKRQEDDAIKGEFVEEKPQRVPPSRAIARVDPATPQELAQWRPEFTEIAVDRAIKQVAEKKRFFENVMKPGAHYAIIPGQKPTPRIDQRTGEQMKDAQGHLLFDPPKPALLKPGAELLNTAMGLHPIITRDITEEMRDNEWFIEVHSTCRIYVQTGPGEVDRMLVAEAGGSCNSWEDKYRYRGQKGRKCPACEMEGTIRRGSARYAPGMREHGKADPGYENGGFYCWKKLDGCGATFPDKDQRILSQTVEKEKNENPHSLKNTLEKMADKRALVAATLIATGCSDLFTQDIEEGMPSPEQKRAATTSASTSDATDDGSEDPGPPTDAAAPAPAPAPAPTAPTPPAEIPDPSGWEYVMPFNRWRQDHADSEANKQFKKFFIDHGFKSWGDMKAAWGRQCWIDADKQYELTIKDEFMSIIGKADAKIVPPTPVQQGFDPDTVKA